MADFFENIMERCLKLALKGKGSVEPNPMVGAILCDENGNIVSEGYHKKYGEAHAEVNCLKDVEADFSKCTLFVNLEPCSHFGKTPPCCDLIIKKGIKRVVVGMSDPNEKVAGKGIEKMKNAGLEVIYPILENKCRELNRIFIKNIITQKSFVAIKTATTLDGKISASDHSSKWITSKKARVEAHSLRAFYDAIMVGSNTVCTDDPSLTAREIEGRNPVRIILDREFKTDFKNKVYLDDGTRIILVTNKKIKAPKHIEILNFENFDILFKTLYQKNIFSVMSEGGSGLNSAILKAREADYLHQFIAPKILGDGLDFVKYLGKNNIKEAINLKIVSTKELDPDILLTCEFVK